MSGIDKEIWLLAAYRSGFENSMERVNRRAKKLKLAPVTWEIVREEQRVVSVTRKKFIDGRWETETTQEPRPAIVVRISHPTPEIKLPGWRYVGAIFAKAAKRDSVSQTVNAKTVHQFGEDPIPQNVLDRAFNDRGLLTCEHCHTFRNRRAAIVVANEANEYKVIGSTCCQEFLGTDFDKIAAYFQNIVSLHTELLPIERNDHWYSLEEFDWAAMEKARNEAENKKKAATYPLVDIVAANIQAILDQGFYARYTTNDHTATEDLTHTILTEGTLARSERRMALAKMIISATSCAYKPDDLVTWQDAQAPGFTTDRASSWAQSHQQPLAGEFYDIGHKLKDIQVTYLGSKQRDTAYGLAYIHLFRDADGSSLEWMTSSPVSVHKGKTAVLSATVKDHAFTAFTAVNKITRAKVS
jgi:hypothetical protein